VESSPSRYRNIFLSQSPKRIQRIFLSRKHLVVCNGVCSLTEAFEHQDDTTEWPLFIDFSKVSLKIVLLHNGNKFPSAPLAQAAKMESYENMKLLWKRSHMKNIIGTFVRI
jgi:hypothetical protein